jgi:hypothetical protein
VLSYTVNIVIYCQYCNILSVLSYTVNIVIYVMLTFDFLSSSGLQLLKNFVVFSCGEYTTKYSSVVFVKIFYFRHCYIILLYFAITVEMALLNYLDIQTGAWVLKF